MKKRHIAIITIIIAILAGLIYIYINKGNIDDDTEIQEIQEAIDNGKSGDSNSYDFYEENNMLIFYGTDRKCTCVYVL